MQILLVWFVAAVAALQTPSVNEGPTRSASVMVRAVINGDTIDVATIGRVHLLGIDAPQIGSRLGNLDTGAPLARAARERLAALVLRRWVRLERDGGGARVSSRRFAYVVRDDGLFVNAVLVREGMARTSARQPSTQSDELARAEAEARSFRRGIWGSAPQVPLTGYTRRSNGGRALSIKSKKAPKTHPKSQKSKTLNTRGRHTRRVRLPAKDPRAQQALLPRQSLADLDLRLFHRTGTAHVRSLRARL